jgi:transposase InsO family protein
MMVYQFMQEHKNHNSIREMAKVFGVSSSACCQWAKHGVSGKRSKRDAELPGLIREIAQKHHYRYGSPRVRETLRQDCGNRASLKKAACLMRENGLNARRRGKFIPATNSNHGLPVCENLLNREFQAATAGAKRGSDITCLRTLGGWLCLTAVLDLFDRKVIGRAFSSDLETVRTTLPTPADGLARRTAQEGLVFHSDRGAQYCSKSFRDALSASCPTVRQSMSRKGNCSGLRVRRILFQNLETGVGNLGRQTFRNGGQASSVYVS